MIPKLKIVPFTRENIPSIKKLASKPNNLRWTNAPTPYPPNGVQEYFDFVQKQITFGFAYEFCIVFQGKPIGLCGLQKVNQSKSEASIGYWLDEDYWGKGIATQCVKELLNYAKNTLELHKIFATTHPHNPASEKVLSKCGFSFQKEIDGQEEHKKWIGDTLKVYCHTL